MERVWIILEKFESDLSFLYETISRNSLLVKSLN